MLLFKTEGDLANEMGQHSVHRKEKKVQAWDETKRSREHLNLR